jgi:HK97 family phage portal protein
MLNLTKQIFGTKEQSSMETKSTVNPYDFTFLSNNIGQVQAFSNFDALTIIRNYETIAPLNSAINLIGGAVGGLPIVVKDKGTQEIVDDHPVLDLLDSPNMNEQRTKESLMSQLAIWRVMEGDAYLEIPGPITKEPMELFIFKPQNMDIQANGGNSTETYRFQSSTQSKIFKREVVSGRIVGLGEDGELLHIKNFNPRASNLQLDGMSEVLPLFFEVNQYLESSNHNLSLLRNGARPSGALTLNSTSTGMPAQLTEEQFSRMKVEMEECYQSSNNAGRPMVLEGGLSWQEMGLSPRDMDFLNLKREAEQQIYKGLGVPIQLKMDVGTTFNNKSEARLEFYENRVIPLANELLSSMTSLLMPRFKQSDDLELAVDMDNVDALAIKRQARTESISSNAVMTLNEKRNALNLKDIESGDQVFTQSGLGIAGDTSDPGV